MSNHRLLLLILLLSYVFAPSLFDWMIAPHEGWYRPFIIWVVIIIAAFLIQKRERHQ